MIAGEHHRPCLPGIISQRRPGLQLGRERSTQAAQGDIDLFMRLGLVGLEVSQLGHLRSA